MVQRELFARAGASPEGFTYSADFLSAAEERELLGAIGGLALAPAQYKEWHARRRVVAFGGSYDFSRNELKAAPPIPDFLQGLRERVARWGGVAAGRIQHAMIAEYPPGSPLGWHRDVPQFEDVFGVSLLGHARLRFRPWPPRPGERTAYALELEPRSAYALRGAARWQWQHAISPTRELRYSITFRTRRA
ncbi:MAG TPA: alpha-ketoglutarate-dependent dioxygenase AlkB [Steroidobacteraceae bacterium]|nr:alpha-ketoglutarate-dependent dioxygenase AlkB [Steroidobacteraceae bacterium]